jgi:hypothetical protein
MQGYHDGKEERHSKRKDDLSTVKPDEEARTPAH